MTMIMRWLQLRFDIDSMAVRRPLDCLSKVIKVTVTKPASRSHSDLLIYSFLGAAARNKYAHGRNTGRRMVVARSDCTEMGFEVGRI